MWETDIEFMLKIQNDETLIKYFNDLENENCIPIINQDDEYALLTKIKEGDIVAKNKLILANLRFVVSCAMRYQNFNVPLNELISEGNMGLIKAIDKFDMSKGVKFFTYAVYWIRHSMQEYVCGYVENNHEVIDITTDELTFDGVLNFIDVIDPDYHDDENVTNIKEIVTKLLSTLNKREYRIIELYYGINGEKMMTLDDIGLEVNLTKERVRQIKKVAMNKLKASILLYNDFNNIYNK